MKTYQKGICLAVAAVVIAGGLTGCGEKSTIRTKEIGAGVSSPEKAAETYINGLINNGELLLTVVPEEYLEYLEDEYYLTEDQLREKVEAYVYNEHGEAEVVSFEIIQKNNYHDMQDLNKTLSELNVDKSEEAYELEFSFQDENGYGDDNMDDSCFEYKGKWYSWAAMEEIEDIAKCADSIIDWKHAEVCTSPEMAAEAYYKGRFENISYFFIAVPPTFIEYLEEEYSLTEKELKEKVEAGTSKYRYEGFDRVIEFDVIDVKYYSYDDNRLRHYRSSYNNETGESYEWYYSIVDELEKNLQNAGIKNSSESYYAIYYECEIADMEGNSRTSYNSGPDDIGDPGVIFKTDLEEGYYSADVIEWLNQCLE